MNQTGKHLVRRIVCPRNPTLCSGTGPGCPPSTAAWRSSSCPYRASSASSFRSAAATLTFNLQPRLVYMYPQWMHFSSANVISLNNGQLSPPLLGASCSLNTTSCISPPHDAWNSEVFMKQPSQTPSHKSPAQIHFLMSPSEITTENKSTCTTCTCTTTKDTSKLIHRCKARFIYSLK